MREQFWTSFKEYSKGKTMKKYSNKCENAVNALFNKYITDLKNGKPLPTWNQEAFID